MDKTVKISEFIEEIKQARREWDSAIEGISGDDFVRPGFCGEWSLKDVLSHLTWYERQMIGLLKARAFVGSDYWQLPTDERNAIIYEENKENDPVQVWSDYKSVYAEMMGLMDQLTDDDLNDPARFPGMPPEWQPWLIFAGNTHEHYRAHLPNVKAFKSKKGGGR